jgi:hypothetical protein
MQEFRNPGEVADREDPPPADAHRLRDLTG